MDFTLLASSFNSLGRRKYLDESLDFHGGDERKRKI